jgi:hypothetical protein
MKLTVSIKTDVFPAVDMSANVETFRDVERLGRKLAAHVKNAGRLLPALRDAGVLAIVVKPVEAVGRKSRRSRKPTEQPATSAA